MRTPKVSPQSLTDARRSAAATRAAWLEALSQGLVTDRDLFEFAATIEGRHLRSLNVHTLLLSLPGATTVTARIGLKRLRMFLGVRSSSTLRVGWLLDGRADRASAFALAAHAPAAPYSGFPFGGVQ